MWGVSIFVRYCLYHACRLCLLLCSKFIKWNILARSVHLHTQIRERRFEKMWWNYVHFSQFHFIYLMFCWSVTNMVSSFSPNSHLLHWSAHLFFFASFSWRPILVSVHPLFVVCHCGTLTLRQCRALNNWCVDVKVWCLTRRQIEPAGSLPLPISQLPALCTTQHTFFFFTHTHLGIQYTHPPRDFPTSMKFTKKNSFCCKSL